MNLDFEPERGFGVYVHWPYCARICPYCDFNVYADKGRDTGALTDAICADLEGWRARSGARSVDTVFFGGGTPSLMSQDAIERVLEKIDQLWGIESDAEISLEANPDDVARFARIADAGVTRLSLGVQSMQDEALRFLGRNHDVLMARRAIDMGRALFKSLSLDFIYALPDQREDEWAGDLAHILTMGADHLSLYELTIERGTAFSKAVERGTWRPADEDSSADLYELTRDMTAAAGYPAYEISNHARSAAHQARHNIVYWRSGDWVGVGPGAHGRLTADGARLATEAARRPQDYIRTVTESAVGWAATEILSNDAIAQERLLMGLRLVKGVARADHDSLASAPIGEDVIDELQSQNLLDVSGDMFSLTPQGRLLADYVGRKLCGV